MDTIPETMEQNCPTARGGVGQMSLGVVEEGSGNRVSAQQGNCLQANSKQKVTLPIQWEFQAVLPMITKAPPPPIRATRRNINTRYLGKGTENFGTKPELVCTKAWRKAMGLRRHRKKELGA